MSDYARDLLPELARLATVRVLAPPGWERPEAWSPAGVAVVAHDSEAEAGEICLVHLGNNPYHEWLLPRLGQDRTVVVLHDPVLHHLLVESTLARQDWEGYQSAIEGAHGAAGRALAAARRWDITGRLDPFLFPARIPFLERASGVLVHSRWAREQVLREFPRLPVCRVGLAMEDPGAVDRTAMRADLGISAQSVLLMHLGFLTPEKGMREILTGVAAAARLGVPVHLVQVGEGELLPRLSQAADSVGIRGRVSATGWVSRGMIARLPAAADLGVVLRTPSAGETSAAALRFLACGTPVAVGGRHQYLEWHHTAAPRLTPGPSAAADLARLLAVVAATRDGEAWARRRQAARAAYEADHRPAEAAARIVAFVSDIAGVAA